VAAGLHPATFLDALCSKSVLSCLDAWRTTFNHPTVQGRHFLTLRGKRTANPFSPATPRVVVGSLTLTSRLHYMLGQLEPSSTMLPLRSTDSAFSL